MPHLVAEAVAYIVAGMAGLFLARGLMKYPARGKEFRQVFGAVLRLALLAVFLIACGALLEAKMAPWLVDMFFRR